MVSWDLSEIFYGLLYASGNNPNTHLDGKIFINFVVVSFVINDTIIIKPETSNLTNKYLIIIIDIC